MKTLKNTLLTGFLTLLISLNLNATISLLIEGEPANNKPKTINTIISDATIVKEFFFEDEEYINDIPFDIDSIFNECNNEKLICESFYFDEEDYIDDIPFNTKTVLDTLTTPSIVWYSNKY